MGARKRRVGVQLHPGEVEGKQHRRRQLLAHGNDEGVAGVLAAPVFAADAGAGGPFPVASAGDAKVARVRRRFRIFRILLGTKLAENHPGRGASAVVELAYRAHPLAIPGQRAVNILEDARVPVALGRIALEHHGYEQRAARTGERHVQQASRLGQGLGARIGR